jgi:glycosyltransferase involved in cell wall biosynthesis
MKTISILIAAYNAQNWLTDCLNAVLAQSLPAGWKMEILLGVDGCDSTLQLTQAIQRPELSVFYLKKNSGTYLTFNTLMRYATGELICRFDADDVMKPGYLSTQIQTIEQGMDMTMTWSIYTDANLVPTSYVLAHEVYHPDQGLNRRGSEGQFVIRRDVWQRLGGFRAWRCGADTDFFKRLRVAGFSHTVIPEFLYFRRTHEQSLTVHPDTNFKSPFRKYIQKLTADYQEQYLAGKRSLKVRPEYVKDHVRL